MSFDFERPQSSVLDTFAGGEASLGEIWRASRDAAVYIDNTLSRGVAIEEAYRRRIEAIKDATGVVVDNPSRTAFSGIPSREELATMLPGENRYDAAKRRFRADLSRLAEQFPEQHGVIGASRPIEDDAQQLARDADEELARTSASRAGILKWGALLGGGISGSLRDPVQVGTLVIGGGPGGARTVGGRVLSVAAKEALINGAVEATLQPSVQAWRKEAGLSHGIDEAIRNVLFAATLGAGFGTVAQGAAEGAARVFGRGLPQTDQLAAELARDSRLPETTRAALDGDYRAAAETLRPIRDELPPAARGALDAADDLARLEEARPRDIAPEPHETATVRAERALEEGPTQPLTFEVDAAQVARITESLMPAEAGKPMTPRAPSLTEFLARAGGIDAAEPEIRVSDLSRVSIPFTGRLAKKGGLSLDQARELAAQNGYMWEFGNIDDATAKTTPDDLMQMLFREQRGERIVPFESMEAGASAADYNAARREVEDMAHEVLAQHGPGLADERVVRAMEIMRDEGVTAEDALARLGEGERTGEPKPGFDDESLLDAAENRPAEPTAEAVGDAFEDPNATAITEAEIEEFGDTLVPDDGELVPLSAYMDEINRADDYAAILEACRA